MGCGLKRVAKTRTYSYQLPFITRRVLVVTTLLCFFLKKASNTNLRAGGLKGDGIALELPENCHRVKRAVKRLVKRVLLKGDGVALERITCK
jgi:hypothetical protein